MRTISILALGLLILSGCTAPANQAQEDPEPWSPPANVAQHEGFVDVAAARGLTGQLGTQDAQDPMETMGGAVAIADVDGDADMDIFLSDTTEDRLYIQENGSFLRDDRGIPATTGTRAAVFFDADNDGDPDLFLGRVKSPSTLLRNEGGHFVDITQESGISINSSVHAAVAGDVDKDGDLDLFIGDYLHYWDAGEGYTPEGQVGRDMLWRNDGGTYTDVSDAWNLTTVAPTLAASMADFDRDGDLDIAASYDFGSPDQILQNDGGSFQVANVGFESMRDGMGTIWADFDNNAWLDLYISNIFGEQGGPVGQGNVLAMNEGGRFRDASFISQTHNALWSWGGVALDAENDGDLDLFVANGFMGASPTFPQAIHGELHLSADPEMSEVMGREQPNRFFVNAGQARFVRGGDLWGLDLGVDGRGAASMDLDDDGDLDLVHAAFGSAPFLLENRAPQGHWLQVSLEGTASDRDAIGAQVFVEADGRLLLQQRATASGYLSQSWPVLHFGLGGSEQADVVHVVWPSGATQTFRDVAADQRIHIVEGSQPVQTV